jgi:predicted transposase/invertase (TIGR01784 family)
MSRLSYALKGDIAFKWAMTNNPHLLKSLLSAALGVTEDSIGPIVITNPEMTPETVGAKRCLLDLNVRIGDDLCALELQLADEGNYAERCLFYLSRLCIGALEKGQDYGQMPRVILISILDFNLFSCKDYHSEFVFTERFRREELSDKLKLLFLEMKKVGGSLDKTDMLALWLCLIKAQDTEELEVLKRLEVGIMSEAIDVVQDLQTDDRMRALAISREMAEHDAAQALSNAEKRGIALGEQRGIALGEKRGVEIGRRIVAEQMLANGFDVSHIAKATGYTEQQVTAILNEKRR